MQLSTFQEYLRSMELTEENRKSRQFEPFPEIFLRPSWNFLCRGWCRFITTECFFCGFIVERGDRVIAGHNIIYFVLFDTAVANSGLYHRMVV